MKTLASRLAVLGCLVVLGAGGAVSESFDYIVVGGGTSGLVIANRLSENPQVTVAVIEAGNDESSNPLVTNPDNFANALNSYLDWNYTTTPQAGINGQSIAAAAGRALGGSSAINGMTYIRANREEIDVWERLGNDGWTWDTLWPYYLKSEEYVRPSPEQSDAGGTYQMGNHGTDGPLRVGYRGNLTNTTASSLILETWDRLSLPLNPDLNSGDTRGIAIGPQTVDPDTDTRWDSARAYLLPVRDRPNLTIIKGTATRVMWREKAENKTSGCHAGLLADGVAYVTQEEEEKTLNVTKEVILSAGAMRSPAILEASGVGNSRILEAAGIEVKIDLPGVGENLQEQPNHFLGFQGSLETVQGAYHGYVTGSRLLGDQFVDTGLATAGKIPDWAEEVANAPGACSHLPASAIEEQLRIQHELLFKYDVPIVEAMTISGLDGFAISQYWILFPFSRGCVHISEDRDKPLIDPNLYGLEFDVDIAVEASKLARQYWSSSPIGDFIQSQVLPSLDVLPLNATLQQWKDFVRSTNTKSSHGFGTTAMMRKDLGGVVDPQLKVYGTRNVRVVDSSIIPMQISGHSTATLYAVAERAADIIKGED